jgi:hypothetical protein
MAESSDYRVSRCKLEGRKPFSNRFLFYSNTQYIDEIPIDKYKNYVQHWLTSKMWSPNKMLQKYYIIITTSIKLVLDKVKRTE